MTALPVSVGSKGMGGPTAPTAEAHSIVRCLSQLLLRGLRQKVLQDYHLRSYRGSRFGDGVYDVATIRAYGDSGGPYRNIAVAVESLRVSPAQWNDPALPRKAGSFPHKE